MRSEHVIMGGASDGGKTTELRRMHAEFDGISVFVNHNSGPGSESYTSNVAGYRASGRKAMQTATGKFDSWEEVRINLKVDDVDEGLKLAIGFAMDVFDTTSAADNPVATQIIVDEAHHADDELLSWVLAEGRDRAIKGVIATQSLQKFRDNAPLKHDVGNARYRVWVGEWSMDNHGAISYYFPVEDMVSERFKVQVFSREGERLFTGETQEKYGG